jgi:DNA-binding transcriptional LysR family regulator
MNELKAITAFAHAADAKSFNQAAVDLGVSPQAVSKMIRQLEQQLGVRLFHRTTRQCSLTVDGLRFLESVKPGLDLVTGAMEQIRASTETIEGPLRISAARSARKVLVPVLAEFNTIYPNVTFDLLLDDAFTDNVAEKIDVGFRSGLAPTSQLIVRRLFAVQQVVCASPTYLAEHGVPTTLSALRQHRCSGFRHHETGRLLPWELNVDGELRSFNIAASFCTNDVEAEVAAVVAGMGIGLLDSINAAADVRAGHLVPLLVEHHSANLAFYLYYAQRSPMPRRVRTFIDFVMERLSGSKQFQLDAAELKATALRGKTRRGDGPTVVTR